MNTDLLRDTILTLARRYDFEEGHSLQDERLALRLFDEMVRLGLIPGDWKSQQPSQSRPAPTDDQPAEAGFPTVAATSSRPVPPHDLLSYAALLHDIGYIEGYEEHHKTAFRLIMAEPIPGLSPRDQALVAHIARYHRGGLPDPTKHTSFAALPVADRALVEQLGAILRFADGLDRSHTDAVQDLRCELDGERLIITLLPGTGDDAERWAGQKKARWFEAVFGVQVTLK
jgi:exopolyphosphatase/pppGpp-phosphohydrolase